METIPISEYVEFDFWTSSTDPEELGDFEIFIRKFSDQYWKVIVQESNDPEMEYIVDAKTLKVMAKEYGIDLNKPMDVIEILDITHRVPAPYPVRVTHA